MASAACTKHGTSVPCFHGCMSSLSANERLQRSRVRRSTTCWWVQHHVATTPCGPFHAKQIRLWRGGSATASTGQTCPWWLARPAEATRWRA
eukprot:2451167-Prymnesium_polylepis.1